MSQRPSGYARLPDELYETPAWVTEALLPHLAVAPPITICEPAGGNGAIVEVLRRAGFPVRSGDIRTGTDFLRVAGLNGCNVVITNPPYNKSEEFIRHAIELTAPDGLVAMLLRVDYDSANTRRYLFETPPFAKQIVLTKRIRWIKNSTGSPSFNHAWFIWDHQHEGPPVKGYAP